MALNKDTIKNIQLLSNVNLLRMLCENSQDYFSEVIDFAKAEANRRGIGNINKETLQQFAQEEVNKIEVQKAREFAKAIPPPNTDLIALQSAADYLSFNLALKRMRSGAVASIIFGIIAILMGLAGMQSNFLNGILVLIGFILLVEGIWVVSDPKPLGILMNGIVIITMGLWNFIALGSWIAAEPLKTTRSYFEQGVLLYAILQLVWGIQNIKQYIRLFRITPKRPTPENARLIDEMVKFIISANPRHEKDIIYFTQRCIPMDREWKGRLMNGMGLFVLGDGEDVLVAGKAQVILEKASQLTIRNATNFRIGKRKMSGSIAPESFQKYQGWAK